MQSRAEASPTNDVSGMMAVEETILNQLRVSPGESTQVNGVTAVARHGQVYPGYGIEFEVSGHSFCPASIVSRATLDIHGDVFHTLPYGMGSIAKMLLPLKIRLSHGASLQNAANGVATNASMSFVVGAKQLPRSRICEILEHLQTKGDKPLVIEVRGMNPASEGEEDLIAFLPTRPSLICRSLACNGSDIRYYGELPIFSRPSNLLEITMWWKWPALFAIGCWSLLICPTVARRFALPVFRLASMPRMVDALPLYPATMEAAFKLGEIRERLARALAEPATAQDQLIAPLLRAAEQAAGRTAGTVTAADVLGVLAEIRRIEAADGLVSRTLGFLTFVNLLWLSAIVGMAVSVGPAAHHVLVPLRALIARISRWLLREVLAPTAARLHRWGVLETAAYLACWSAVVHGTAHPGTDVGSMVVLTGLALAAPALAYSTLLWGGATARRLPPRTRLHLAQAWVAACWGPCAVAAGSPLLGYGAVAAAHGALGFTVVVGRLAVLVGFSCEEDLHRVCATSALLLSALLAARAAGAAPAALAPLAPAVGVVGGVVMCVGLLVASSEHHSWCAARPRAFYAANAVAVGALLGFHLAGSALGVPGLANVCATFWALWAAQKYAEFHLSRGYNGWLLALGLSAGVWRASLFLHAHPEYVAGMLRW